MMKYLKTALVLTFIAGICAALIASVNMVTSKIIADNAKRKKAELCQQIFSDYDADKSIIYSEGFESPYIIEKVEAYNSSSELIGYIYTVSGSNSYGKIELLVGINVDLTLNSVRFITNGQSFSSETEAHVNGSYNSGLTSSDVEGIDTACGATFGAKLVKQLVGAAFADCQQGRD